MEETSVPLEHISLSSLLQKDRVNMKELSAQYQPMLELVRILIGVVPNCDPYLEIWPVAFRTYNVMVPNFLNLPSCLFGFGLSKAYLALSVFHSSQTSKCSYCTAHCCSFALRRGLDAKKLAETPETTDTFTPEELAVISASRRLAMVPCTFSLEDKKELEQKFSPDDAQWIVLGASLMGFLNKFMDSIGVELEVSTFREIRSVMGEDWSPGKNGQLIDLSRDSATPIPAVDSFREYLGVLYYGPQASLLDWKWTQGVPDSWPQVGEYLQDKVGFSFPFLKKLRHRSAIKAIATVLKDNLNPEVSAIGMEKKILTGAIFASRIESSHLSEYLRAMANKFDVLPQDMENATNYGNPFQSMEQFPGEKWDMKDQTLFSLARAASPSPSAVDTAIVKRCQQSELTSVSIVELISWLSVLQMLHRLTSFFIVDEE